jgi:hypothetical protein
MEKIKHIDPPTDKLSKLEQIVTDTEEKMNMEEMQTLTLDHVKTRDKIAMLCQKEPIANLQGDINCMVSSIEQVLLVGRKNEAETVYWTKIKKDIEE